MKSRLSKFSISIGTPEKLVALPTKVTKENQARFRALLKKGHTADDLIKTACEAYEAHYAELESNTKSGKTKKHYSLMQKVK